MDERNDELYRRVARLAYLARFEVSDSWAVAHRIADAAARKASKASKASKETTDSATGSANDSAIDWALTAIARAGRKPSRRVRRRFGPVAPVEPTEAQAEVLRRLARLSVSVRLGTLLHLLDDVPVAEASSRVWSFGPATEERIRDAVKSVQGDLTTKGIRELLAGDGLDPMRAGVSRTDVAADRRYRMRRSAALGTAAALAVAAGVWWYVLRTPPLGTFADDPLVHNQPPSDTDLSIGRWPARGELLGDTALLRRAADAWRANGPAPTGRPAVLFAGFVHGTKVVVMDARSLVAVYTDGDSNTSRVWVNPADDFAFSSGIRLKNERYRVDWVLLPPGVTSAEAGSMTAPAGSWHPVPIDARGVAQVSSPQETNEQISHDAQVGTYPAGGIRFMLPDTFGTIKMNPITLAESFGSFAPVLPSVEPSYDARHTSTPLSAADWCVAQKTAEQSRSLAAYSTESLSDAAGGPLPDGGGTGTIVDQTAMTAGLGLMPAGSDMLEILRLATTTGGGTCGVTDPAIGNDPDLFVAKGTSWPTPGYFDGADAVLWTSPANKTYLVVAAFGKAASIRVSGTATASGNGRWLVVGVPDTFDMTFKGLAVQALDANGHICGTPVIAGASSKYCE